MSFILTYKRMSSDIHTTSIMLHQSGTKDAPNMQRIAQLLPWHGEIRDNYKHQGQFLPLTTKLFW